MPVRVYGVTEIETDEGTRRVSGARERAILAYLVTRASGIVSADALLEEFWPERPDAIASLRVRIANLRKALAGSGVELASVPGGYRLEVAPGALDLDEVRRLLAEARRASGQARLEFLEAAERLRRGGPFAEFAFEDFALPAIRADEEVRIDLTLLAGEALIELNRSAEATERLVAEFEQRPHDERVAMVLMRSLAAEGRVTDALDVFKAVATALAERGLEPGDDLRWLEESILLGETGIGEEPTLPRLPVLVARDDDIEVLAALAVARPLVTVTGPPGVGKTALAIATGHRLAAELPVVLVELAETRGAEGALAALADGLGASGGVTSAVQLAGRIPRRRSVLIVDNCEHLLPEVSGLLDGLAGAAPFLSIIATSRVALQAAGEQRYPLEPLPLPAPDASPEEITASPAVELFTMRAGAVQPRFRIDAGNERAVARLCRALDGLPLAIELAAGRIAALSPAQILERLGDRLAVLPDRPAAPAHRRTLEATIAWSIGLLPDSARVLLGAVSVFRGGFDLEGAEAVAGDEVGDVLGGLDELIAHSLLLVQPDSEPVRYRLLESIASVAGSLVDEERAGEYRRRLCDHILSLAARIAEPDDPAESRARIASLDAERANVRESLGLLVTERPEEAARFMADSWIWWHMRGHWGEGAAIVQQLLAHAVPADPELRHRFYRSAVRLILFGTDHDDLFTHLDDADRLAARLGRQPDRPVRALGLRMAGAYEEAAALHQAEAGVSRAEGRSARVEYANLAALRVMQGRLAEARAAAQEAIREAQAFAETDRDTTPVTMAEVELLEGRYAEAAATALEWYEHAKAAEAEAGFRAESLSVYLIAMAKQGKVAETGRRLGELLGLATAMGGIYHHVALVTAAEVAMARGCVRDAVHLIGAARTEPEGAVRPELSAVEAEVEEAANAAALDTPAELAVGASLGPAAAFRLAHSLVAPQQ